MKILVSLLIVGMTYSFAEAGGFIPASTASSKDEALEAFKRVGYTLNENDLHRKGDQSTGAGFWEAIVFIRDKESRISHLGRGEYIRPHHHNQTEDFEVTDGGCDFWMFNAQEKVWVHQSVHKGQSLKVPANVIHCLVASDREGLTMHIMRNDLDRTTDFTQEVGFPF